MKIKLEPGATLPTKAHPTDAGYDLYANEDAQIKPHETRPTHTGIHLQIPDGYFGAVFARSGLATKQGLRPANCVGVIDSDYRGEIIVALHNDSDELRNVAKGDRIAQLVILPCPHFELELADELDETKRGAGGFGSSGK